MAFTLPGRSLCLSFLGPFTCLYTTLVHALTCILTCAHIRQHACMCVHGMGGGMSVNVNVLSCMYVCVCVHVCVTVHAEGISTSVSTHMCKHVSGYTHLCGYTYGHGMSTFVSVYSHECAHMCVASRYTYLCAYVEGVHAHFSLLGIG